MSNPPRLGDPRSNARGVIEHVGEDRILRSMDPRVRRPAFLDVQAFKLVFHQASREHPRLAIGLRNTLLSAAFGIRSILVIIGSLRGLAGSSIEERGTFSGFLPEWKRKGIIPGQRRVSSAMNGIAPGTPREPDRENWWRVKPG